MTGGDRQGTLLNCMKRAFGIRLQVCRQKNSTATVAVTVQGNPLNVSGVWNCDFFDLCFAAVNGHHGESNLLIEPALAAASRIQPEDAIHHLLGVFMRMTVDHHISVVQVFGYKFLVMNHKESAFLNLKG